VAAALGRTVGPGTAGIPAVGATDVGATDAVGAIGVISAGPVRLAAGATGVTGDTGADDVGAVGAIDAAGAGAGAGAGAAAPEPLDEQPANPTVTNMITPRVAVRISFIRSPPRKFVIVVTGIVPRMNRSCPPHESWVGKRSVSSPIRLVRPERWG